MILIIRNLYIVSYCIKNFPCYFMKKRILNILCCLIGTMVIGQVTNTGLPKSWEMQSKKNVAVIEMPSFDLGVLGYTAQWR